MSKRTLALLAVGSLIASIFVLAPANAQDAPPTTIPEVVQIDDPVGDANTQSGDQVLPADASTVGDIMKVWFSNDESTISLHFQVEGNPPASASNYRYNVYANPAEGKTGTSSCLRFEILPVASPAGAYQGEQVAKVMDRCLEDGTFYRSDRGVKGELKFEILEDGTGLMTATFPRDYSPAFSAGAVVTQPFAIDYVGGGTDKASVPASPVTNEGPPGFSGLRVDDSKIGTDYTMSAGDAPPPVDEPPTDEPPPADGDVGNDDPNSGGPKEKDCSKIKNKKARKKCIKKNKGGEDDPGTGPSCPAYTPGEQGAEAPLALVTDAHTAEAPLEITVTQGPGAVEEVSDAFANIQVDSAAAEGGLYVRYEFPDYEDHDLYINYADGTEAAHVGGFNPAPLIPNNGIFWTDGTGTGGHSEMGAEQLDGLRTADCAGYTAKFTNFLGQGGDYTVKLWLGEIQNDPAAPAA